MGEPASYALFGDRTGHTGRDEPDRQQKLRQRGRAECGLSANIAVSPIVRNPEF